MTSRTDKIATISSLEELNGYVAEARKRGIEPDEMAAIYQRQRELGPKGRTA